MKETKMVLRLMIFTLALIMFLTFVVACTSSTPTSTTPATTAVPATSVSPTPSASAAATSSAASSTNASSTESPTASGTTILLVAEKLAFNITVITVKAGAPVTINFDNKDRGVMHNFSLYTDSSATTPIFQGRARMGPTATAYKFTAPTTPGTYYFRDDTYPDTMNGQFIVQ